MDLLTRDYPRFRADTDRENRIYKSDRVEEYLFCLKKDEGRRLFMDRITYGGER